MAFAVALMAGLGLWAQPSLAQSASWLTSPASNNYNDGANWSLGAVPADTAFFGTSSQTSLDITSFAILGGWTFITGANDYVFDLGSVSRLEFTGAGIAVDGGSVTINNTFGNLIAFNNTSTAGSATINHSLGVLDFNDNSTAGSATINNSHGMGFNDSSSAGSATITNQTGGTVTFRGTSTAGNATITNQAGGRTDFTDDSDAGTAELIIELGGVINFNDASNAANATITGRGTVNFNDTSSAGSANLTRGGAIFHDTSTAGNATITNSSTLGFMDASTAGSANITNAGRMILSGSATAGSANVTNNQRIVFNNNTTAGNANITNNANLTFAGNSTGGQAQITTTAMGVTDFSGSGGPLDNGSLTVGSLAGAGSYILGTNELTVGGNDLSSEVTGVISGVDGSLIKTGAGTFTLSGMNTYTGPTTVNGGTLAVNGSIVSETTVNNGGMLGGTGQLGPLTVNNGGIYAPGNSIGTQTVNGAFTLGAGSIYEVEVNAAGQSDLVIVNGTVNLTGATLSVLAANGNYNTTTDYTIIDNDGTDAVTGTFAAITSSLAFLTPTVLYNAGTGNDVVLTLERNETMFPDVAQTPNQKAVAGALEKFSTGNDLFLAVLNQTASGARQAFDALSGEIHATVGGVLADDSRYVREAIMGRLMQAGHTDNSLGAAGPQVASLEQNAMALAPLAGDNVAAQSSSLAFWTAAYGAWGNYDGNRNAASADRDLGGFVSGMDASIGGSWRVGLAAGASYASIDVNGRNSSADVDSFTLAGYAGGMAGAFALRGGGNWAWNEIDTSRAVIFPGFFERQKASYDADTGQIFGEVAYPTSMGGMSVEPFAGLAYVSVNTDTFRERGGVLASLRGRDTDQNVGYSTLGFRAATTTQWGSTEVTPHFSAAWQHAFNDVTPGAALAFASNGIGFNVTGVPLATNSALIDTGLDFALGANLNAGVSYSGQFGDGVQDNAVKGRFTWIF